jgi:hypothetical protein
MSLDMVQTREQAMEFLEGYAFERKEELDRGKTTAGLVKSYLLETVPQGAVRPDLAWVCQSAGARFDRIEGDMGKVWDNGLGRYVGLLEELLPRHPVFYSNEDVRVIDRWVRDLVNATPFLDRLWLSGLTFDRLWEKVVQINPGRRYGRLAFEHQSVFEIDSEEPEEEGDEELEHGDAPDELLVERTELVRERRASRFTVVERIELLKERLPRLQEIYHPLYSISQLRFPAVGRGGHDFYYNGKVTNRSDSFADHRAHLLYVLKIYKQATEAAERTAWYARERIQEPPATDFTTLRGAPVVMRFSEELTSQVFEQWISSTFRHKRNRFRLWGTPIPLGSKKVHVYGADRHLWQRIFLEITTRHLIAVLPEGTCGNTIHRLVTNVQHFVDPAVQVWVGDQRYQDFIRTAAEQQEEGPHDSGRGRG